MQEGALLKRASKAQEKRDAFASLMRDVYSLAMPERDAWNSYGMGQDRFVQVYDSTAIAATPRFATRLQAAVCPTQQRWAGLTLPPELATDDAAAEVQVDLEAARNILFSHIHVSNFDMVFHEYAQDLAAGVGCMLIEAGRLVTKRSRAPYLRFQALPSALVAFDEGPFGGVEGVFFTQRLPARLVRRTYPDANNVPDCIAKAEQEDPDREIELLQATYYDPEDDRYRFEVLEKGGCERFVQRSYRTMPWVITRWTKAPGETHGRGPLTQALPDIRTVNKIMEFMLKTASLAIGGVWTAVDDGVLNPATVRVTPGSVIPVGSNGGSRGPSLQGLPLAGNFQLSETLRQQLMTSIRQMLFDDPLPPEITAGLTATEVIERVRRFQADTGAFGRLHTDLVTPVVVRCIDILDEAGQFADPRFKQLLEALQNDAIRVRATSPLAQAQDNADVAAVMGFIGGAAKLGDLAAPFLEAGISMERAAPYGAEKQGVPHQRIPTAAELAAKRQAAAQQQQQAQALQSPAVAQVAGAVAGAAANPPTPEPLA